MLQEKCNESLARQMQHHPSLAMLEDRSLHDGQSTVGGSVSGTPRASVAPSAGGTKLKLTFGGGGGGASASNGVTTNGTVSGAGSGAE